MWEIKEQPIQTWYAYHDQQWRSWVTASLRWKVDDYGAITNEIYCEILSPTLIGIAAKFG